MSAPAARAAFKATIAIPVSEPDIALARLAVDALREELEAYPKPGLVSPVDSGAHDDMDFALMCRSAESLLQPFARLAAAGRRRLSFDQALKPLGIEAERHMLAATGGVNTHRGAIFCMGLVLAALADRMAAGAELMPDKVQAALTAKWGAALARHAALGGDDGSHGSVVRRRTGLAGARREAALGLPSVFQVGLPTYRRALADGLNANAAAIETLFVLMASVDDTTVLFRGGLDAGRLVRHSAAEFLAAGGCRRPSWSDDAERLHGVFTASGISAGGCADLLACTLLVSKCCKG
ncbi:MAG: triphosphoribosyl-dephospho-CoA synthase [Pseudomonadota bacterium]